MQSESRRPGEGDGSAIVDPAGRHSEPNASKATSQPLDPIAIFAPWAADAERALRLRIYRARDTATAKATRCKHGNARQLLWLAAQLAAERVFARMPNGDLKETIENLARLFLVAGWIERSEAPDAE